MAAPALVALLAAAPICAVAAQVDEHPPTWRGEVHPSAPRLAYGVHASGEVVVEALVDDRGILRGTNILRSQPLLDDAAVAAVSRLRFEPGRRGESFAAAAVPVPVVFPAPPEDRPAGANAERLCQETVLEVEAPARPDSSGWVELHWRARGLKSQELRLALLHPDGVQVDTSASAGVERLSDAEDGPEWPSWSRKGKELRGGAEGTIRIHLPDRVWWLRSRIALVGLFRNPLATPTVVRQLVIQVERDPVGWLLVRDPTVNACLSRTS